MFECPFPSLSSVSLVMRLHGDTWDIEINITGLTLPWRHNELDGVSNHQPYDLLNRLFRQRSKKKNQGSASLALVWGIHRWPVNFPHKGPVTRKKFPFDDVIMIITTAIQLEIMARPGCRHMLVCMETWIREPTLCDASHWDLNSVFRIWWYTSINQHPGICNTPYMVVGILVCAGMCRHLTTCRHVAMWWHTTHLWYQHFGLLGGDILVHTGMYQHPSSCNKIARTTNSSSWRTTYDNIRGPGCWILSGLL